MKIDGANIISGSQMSFTSSQISSTLINYYADYSANFSSFSLVDKKYSDLKFTNGTWSCNVACSDPSAEITQDSNAVYQIYKGVDGGYDIMNFMITCGALGLNLSQFDFTFEPPTGFVIRSSSDSTTGSITISQQGVSQLGDLYTYQNIDTMYVDSVNSSGWKIRANFDLTNGFNIPSAGFYFIISGTSEGTYTP